MVKGKKVSVKGDVEFFFILRLLTRQQRDLNFWLFLKGVAKI